MKIHFLGTSHGAPEKGRYCTSLVIEVNDSYYVIDFGAPLEYLMKEKDMDMAKIKAAFVTHMHADHAEGLTSFAKYYAVYNRSASVDLFMPENIDPYRSWIESLHIEIPKRYRIHLTEAGICFQDENVMVHAVRTEHISKETPSYSFVFTAEGKSVLFSGDLAYDFHDVPLEGKYDLAVCELTHATLEEICDQLGKLDTKQIIFSHVYPQKVEAFTRLENPLPFPYQIACDGMEVTI